MQTTKLIRSDQAVSGTPIFSETDIERLRAFLDRSKSDSTTEFFNRRLRAAMNLVKLRHRQGEISKARAIDKAMCLLECANRRDGFCYQFLKSELRKERAQWTVK